MTELKIKFQLYLKTDIKKIKLIISKAWSIKRISQTFYLDCMYVLLRTIRFCNYNWLCSYTINIDQCIFFVRMEISSINHYHIIQLDIKQYTDCKINLSPREFKSLMACFWRYSNIHNFGRAFFKCNSGSC